MENREIINEINSASIDDLVKVLDQVVDSLLSSSFTKDYADSISIEDGNKYYTLFDINNLSEDERNILFKAILKNICFFYFVRSKESCFPIAAFNSVKSGLLGESIVYINTKSTVLLDINGNLKTKIGLRSKTNYSKSNGNSHYPTSDKWLIEASGTIDPETMNQVYWNLD